MNRIYFYYSRRKLVQKSGKKIARRLQLTQQKGEINAGTCNQNRTLKLNVNVVERLWLFCCYCTDDDYTLIYGQLNNI